MAAATKAAVGVSRRLRLPPMPSVADLIRLYKLRAFKHLSQNFLLNERITDKLVGTAGNIEGHHVCEVGPGPGPITRSIMRQNPASLTVIEKDERFLPTLELLKTASKGSMNFNIILGDILKTNFKQMFPEAIKQDWYDQSPNIHLIGNLPFSVSTILIIKWLEAISKRESAWTYGRTRMTLTFQKEVAERMVATEAHESRCRLSVMCQNWCNVKYKFTISGKSFIPEPEVDVGVVTFVPLKKPLIDVDFKILEKFLRTTFNMRQKFCSKGVSMLFPPDLRDSLKPLIFEMADLDPETRPFQISNHEFKRLVMAYSKIVEKYPDIVDYDFRARKKPIGYVKRKPEEFQDDEKIYDSKSFLAI